MEVPSIASPAEIQAPPIKVDEYDIFISHCGADCKRDFAVWLKEELERAGVRCFFDEESLRIGDEAAGKMLQAMETAAYGIVILSPGFFLQEWCVKELHTFVRRKRLVPIFLPSANRGGEKAPPDSGLSAFQVVEDGKRRAIERKVWEGFERFVRTEAEYMEAVTFSFTGVRLDACDGFWNTCIRKATKAVLELLGKVEGGLRLSEEELLVGQREHLLSVKQLLGLPMGARASKTSEEASRVVGIVGVKGRGGVGKSTLAKKLYDEPDVREWFGGNICWVEVGEEPGDEKICKLQWQILKTLSGLDEEPGNPTLGRALIRERLRNKKVLVCLDDIWGCKSTAQAVVTERDLGPGSCILKTSRSKEAIGGMIHDLNVLGPELAWELLCWHAFKGETPPTLAMQAKKALGKCGGLPLAIKLLGSQIAEVADKGKWLEEFMILETNADPMISSLEVIKRSYASLPSQPLKDVFMLLALWPNSGAFRVQINAIRHLGAVVYGGESPLKKRQALAKNALEMLANRSLIRMESEEDWRGETSIRITIHDLLVEVATNLANEGDQTTRRFFRWVPGDTELEPYWGRAWSHLTISNGKIPINCLTTQNSSIISLVATDVSGLQEFKNKDQAVSHCRLLTIHGIPTRIIELRLHLLMHLQCLRLVGCEGMVLLMELGSMKTLNVLEITFCQASGQLPEEWAKLTGLQVLNLAHNNLSGHLPEGWAALTELQTLDLRFNLLSGPLPKGWAALTGLQRLDLGSNQLCGPLPEGWAALTGLQMLGLEYNQLSPWLPEEWARALTELRTVSVWPQGGAAARTELRTVSPWPNQPSGPLPKFWGPANEAIGARAHLVQQFPPPPPPPPPPPSPEAGVRLTEAEMLHLRLNQLRGPVQEGWSGQIGADGARDDALEVRKRWRCCF